MNCGELLLEAVCWSIDEPVAPENRQMQNPQRQNVPQKCGNRICGATDNFFNGSIINSVGNISNFVTFSSIGTLYFIEMKRENWCIKYLDIDDNKSSNNLDEEIEKYPK